MTPQRGTPSIIATVRGALDASPSAPRVVLAVSGGIDSMVLLDAAANGGCERREMIVATFDHGTGPAATSACELVEHVATEQGVECVIGRAPLGLHRSEAAWRDARWTFLRTVAASRSATVATAHTADDQIETILMRVLRDAGPRGLAALEAPSELLRPLLAFRRTAITAYATARGVKWIDDPSNDSPAFLRNRVRRDLLPALRRADRQFDEDLLALGQTAAAWRRETDALARDVSQVRGIDAIEVDLASIRTLGAAELSLLWPAIAGRVGLTLDRRGTLRLAAFGRSSRVGSRVQVSGGWEAVRSRDAVHLGRTAQTIGAEMTLDLSSATRWDGWTFWPRAHGRLVSAPGRREPGWEAELPADRPLRIRAWRPGDRFVGESGGLGRKVKRLLGDAGVTGHERTGWPVVLCEDRIVWIPGVRRSGAATERSGRPSLHFSCARYSG
jgi:tRNA(Ile)-lysidine synthase